MYTVTLEANYLGQQIINSWDFVSGTVPSGQLGSLLVLAGWGLAPFDTIELFGEDTVASKFALAQAGSVVYVQAICKNLYSNTDFYTFAFDAATHGQRSGQGLSPVSAAGFSTDRTVANIRRGQKRFVGVVEGDVDDGGVINADGRTVWENVGGAMENVTVVPVGAGTFTFTPYVFSKHRVVDPDTGRVSYEAWPDEATAMEHIARINQWNLKPQVRSQVSRQYGRGS
jgi:hypothetical protein